MRKFIVKASTSAKSPEEQYHSALIQTILHNYEYGSNDAYPFMFGWLSTAYDRIAGKGATNKLLEDICEYEGYELPEKPY